MRAVSGRIWRIRCCSGTRGPASRRPRSRRARRARRRTRCSTRSARSIAGRASGIDGAVAGYRGQIGRNAAIPHALTNNIVFQAGDVLVTGATAPVWGYHSELERTMVIGPPSDEQKRMFDHMVALQDSRSPRSAGCPVRRGRPCRARVLRESTGSGTNWRHHVGHAIGLRYHEGPFLDRGDGTEIRPGMVFTVEPGLYAPALGGVPPPFRHGCGNRRRRRMADVLPASTSSR